MVDMSQGFNVKDRIAAMPGSVKVPRPKSCWYQGSVRRDGVLSLISVK